LPLAAPHAKRIARRRLDDQRRESEVILHQRRHNRIDGGLFEIDPIAHHPDFQLAEPFFSARLVRLHPFAIGRGVPDIYHDEAEIVPVERVTVLPISLCRILKKSDGAELLYDLFYRLADEIPWHFLAIIVPCR
jgi:hypothetical protein